MTPAARLLPLLVLGLFFGACGHLAPPTPSPRPSATGAPLPPDVLRPSPNRLVGSVLAVDTTRGFAFIGLTDEPPAAALVEGAELIARTAGLHETARLRASRYVRGRTLGTTIISGQPTKGDEVVFRAP